MLSREELPQEAVIIPIGMSFSFFQESYAKPNATGTCWGTSAHFFPITLSVRSL